MSGGSSERWGDYRRALPESCTNSRPPTHSHESVLDHTHTLTHVLYTHSFIDHISLLRSSQEHDDSLYLPTSKFTTLRVPLAVDEIARHMTLKNSRYSNDRLITPSASINRFHLSSAVEFWITEYYHLSRLLNARHRPILLCAHFHFLLLYAITIHQRYRQTDTDRNAHSISAKRVRLITLAVSIAVSVKQMTGVRPSVRLSVCLSVQHVVISQNSTRLDDESVVACYFRDDDEHIRRRRINSPTRPSYVSTLLSEGRYTCYFQLYSRKAGRLRSLLQRRSFLRCRILRRMTSGCRICNPSNSAVY